VQIRRSFVVSRWNAALRSSIVDRHPHDPFLPFSALQRIAEPVEQQK
jgi:hypothetical protein